MKKRINSTGRKKLSPEEIDIRICTTDGLKHPSFSANFDFSSLERLDKKAKVYVEPYVVSSSMRFDFGTLGALVSPTDTTLSELDIGDSILFRVKVVDESGAVGRILADARGVRPRGEADDEENRKALLPLCIMDIGELIWRVDHNPHQGPQLQISNKVPGLSAKLKDDPLLQGAIYPQALAEVLQRVLNSEAEIDDEAQWVTNWRLFVATLLGRDLEEDLPEEELSEVVDETVRAFCKHHGFATRAKMREDKPL